MQRSPLPWILAAAAFVLGCVVTAAVILMPRVLPALQSANDVGPTMRVVLRARSAAEFPYTLRRDARVTSAPEAGRMGGRLRARLEKALGSDAGVNVALTDQAVIVTTRAADLPETQRQLAVIDTAMVAVFGKTGVGDGPVSAAECFRPADAMAMRQAGEVLDRRLREMGMRRASVRVEGDRIVVETRAGRDPQATRELLTTSGELRLMLLAEDIVPGHEAQGRVSFTRGGREIDSRDALRDAILAIRGRDFDPGAIGYSVGQDGPQIDFGLKPEAARHFEAVTGANIGCHLAIVYDDVIVSAPVIRGAIGARGQISGSFTEEQARRMAATMKAGALPLPLEVVEE